MLNVHCLVSVLVLGVCAACLTACGDGHEDNGATASLTWDSVDHPTEIHYTVHYGRQSSGFPGSCEYENSVDVAHPSATITGLEYETPYYFVVSAYTEDGGRSACSDEVLKVTPGSPLNEDEIRIDPGSGHNEGQRPRQELRLGGD
jgi:hypothetical protein